MQSQMQSLRPLKWGVQSMTRVAVLTAFAVLFAVQSLFAGQYQLVYTSDQHYGITRPTFRGQKDVSAETVNAAMVEAIKALPQQVLPSDGGVRAGQPVQWADFVISTGDIANRMESPDGAAVPTAAECWNTFADQYLKAPLLMRRDGTPAEVLVVPGNHDVTNAVGFHRPMKPAMDKSAVAAMYNRNTGQNMAAETFDVAANKVFIRRDLDDLQLLFVQMWPDSAARTWLKGQFGKAPVLLFTHDQPDVEAKHFVNPNGDGGINSKDKFENLLADTSSVSGSKETPVKEHNELVDFLKSSPVVAYFHGNENHNEFYTWAGPDKNLSLPVFRVDSPMKGNESGKDEARLSFQLVSIDTDSRTMTVREVLWNAAKDRPLTWGAGKTLNY